MMFGVDRMMDVSGPHEAATWTTGPQGVKGGLALPALLWSRLKTDFKWYLVDKYERFVIRAILETVPQRARSSSCRKQEFFDEES
ncbi:hypothetical protein J6590_002268 [Homalodisca vitripennis]|nr:hypothetical protein J6590_002268 [Homalodisca vitripennis]